MNINASIVDQRLNGIMQDAADLLPPGDEGRRRSAAFVLLCMSTSLDITLEEAADLLTDGGNDAGVDGLQIGEVEDGEFLVTLFQGKYRINNLAGTANFPENGVQKAVNTVQILFDPFREVAMNRRLAPRVEEIRSLIRDGYIPRVRFVLCNNGAKWNETAQAWIDELARGNPDKIEFCHCNHDSIVSILQRTQEVNVALQLRGQRIVEDMNFMRVLLGRISVQNIAELFEQYGDRLLQRNIRRYLGLKNNRVNMAIQNTLLSDKADNFYFYNNGITVVCDKLEYNAFQTDDNIVRLKNMQIINGGQTCKTIHETLKSSPGTNVASAYVMIRIYQLEEDSRDFIQDITYATNSQNPVDLRDLRSNDELQKTLELGMKGLGYVYKRQREEGVTGADVITSAVAAEAVLAVWRERPHQARFRRSEHFGKLYNDIFVGLDPAQAVVATLIFRGVENRRKRPAEETPPPFIPYASHYISMLVGRELLKDEDLTVDGITHATFGRLVEKLRAKERAYHESAVSKVAEALQRLYGRREVSLQQLSATFRRGDLLEMLQGE
jgi:hypothetical protein